jgi:DNA-binding LacI/PurR family transcriptional regulator
MATMADIARRAGVSLSTVSYALSGKRPISAATKQRVLAAIDELDFHPHAAGRALASRRSETIALLYPSSPYGFPEASFEFVTGAATVASSRGYAFLLSTAPAEVDEVERLIRRGFVDGLILMEIRLDDPRVELLKARSFPFSMIGHCRCNDGLSYVDLDFVDAVGRLVHHLADLGHQHIALLSREAPLLDAGYGPAVRSLEGFRHAVMERSLRGVGTTSGTTPQDGFDTIVRLLTDHPDLTGIITINLEAIGGIVRAIYHRGLTIPDDISLVAVCSSRQAEMVTPALTTIDFPMAEMGRMGADLLLRQLEEVRSSRFSSYFGRH